MHAYVLISLFSAVAAAVLASAIWARDPSNRGSQLAGLLLTCTALWALGDVLCNTASNASAALEAIRWSSAGGILIGPVAFHLLLTIEPKLVPRHGRFLQLAYGLSILFAIAAVTTPAMWVSVKPTAWGWVGVIADGVAVSWFFVIGFPAAALVDWFRVRDRAMKIDPWLALGVCIPALLSTMTDFVLPLAEVAAPRLGSASLAAWGAIAFGTVYRFRRPILAPHLFAREILETLPDGVVLLRLDGTIRSSNGRMTRLAGRAPAELLGRPIDRILESRPAGHADLTDERELRLLRPSGESIPVAVNEAPLYDEDGYALGRVLVVRDLREVVSLRGRLVASGRLAAVGQLSAGIAHEINNPIAYVRSNLNLLEEHWGTVKAAFEKNPAGPVVQEILEDGFEMLAEVEGGLDRVASTVRDVGGFSKAGRTSQENADINELLDTALRIASPQLRKRASVEKEYGNLPLVPCVAQELMQVFLNLLLNAAHSMKKIGTIRLVTECEDGLIRVRVVDDGSGMDDATLGQIFTPFFTTKPVGEGTGLGLSISRQILVKHGGNIEIESSPERGTSVLVWIPIGRAEPPASVPEAIR